MTDTAERSVKIPIVLASSRDHDRASLEVALSGTPWVPVPATNKQEVLESLHYAAVPIVLCDAVFDRLPWRTMLRGVLRIRRRACMILLTDDSNPQLSTEVVRTGGFDLLTRPFEKEQVLATLISAYTQCGVHRPASARPRHASFVIA
jgi:DNA-binding NtrC family response regulator